VLGLRPGRSREVPRRRRPSGRTWVLSPACHRVGSPDRRRSRRDRKGVSRRRSLRLRRGLARHQRSSSINSGEDAEGQRLHEGHARGQDRWCSGQWRHHRAPPMPAGTDRI